MRVCLHQAAEGDEDGGERPDLPGERHEDVPHAARPATIRRHSSCEMSVSEGANHGVRGAGMKMSPMLQSCRDTGTRGGRESQRRERREAPKKKGYSGQTKSRGPFGFKTNLPVLRGSNMILFCQIARKG